MVASTPTSKRRPYPYDLYLDDVRCILEPQADGNLVTKKTRTLDATAPVDYTYSSANPYKERAFEWRELYGGFGQGTAPPGGLSGSPPRRYSYAQYADMSIDGLWMKGPKFETHVETINAAAGEVRQLLWAMHGGALALFAICENAVYRRVADNNWTVSLTAATLAGAKPQQALRFKHRGASPVDALYLGTTASNLYQYDGATWTLAAAAAGPGTAAVQGEARFIERVNDELWVAGDYWVVKVTDSPMVRANYSAVIYVGDQTAKITWLKQLGDTLIIWKEDGVYTVDTSGLDHELFPTLRGKNNTKNGKNAAVWIDKVWFTFGDQSFMMTEDGVLKPDGMEQMLENDSDVHGEWVAGAGHNTWFFYEMIYNADNDMTYLLKHGTWVEENSNQATPGVAQYAEAHHGAIYEWDKKATCAEIVAGLHPTGNDRLYVGFLDGTVQWCVLPQNSPNPAEDTHCFIGSTEIRGISPEATSRRWFEGEVIEITTRSGQKVTGTSNHPILTQRGWVALGQLMESDSVFSRLPSEEVTFANPDKQHRVPTFQEIFDLSTFRGSVVGHSGSNQQFHGDGQDTDVEVVATDSLLRDWLQSGLLEPGHQEFFPSSDEELSVLFGFRESMQMFVGELAAANSSVSSRHLMQPSFGRLELGAKNVGLRSTSDVYSPSLQVLPDVMRSQPVATTEGLSRLPAQVRSDDLVSIERKFFSGHVYNLQTEGHWYFANNIIAHNCEFTSLSSYIYLPVHHSGFVADNKLWHAITVMGPRLTSTEWVEVEYLLDISNDLASWTKVNPDNPQFTIPSQRRNFTADEVASPVSGKLMKLRIKLEKDPSLSASPTQLSPVIEGIVIHESIRPAFSREFTFSVKAGSFLPLRDGRVDRRRGAAQKDLILGKCAQVGPVNVLMPTGELEALTIIDYSDSAASWAKRRDHEWLVVIQGIQLGILSNESLIISTGLTYRTLEQYTVGELESII